MDIALSSRPFIANVIRVDSPVSIEASLDLGFGITVLRKIILETVSISDIPEGCRDRAFHCLIVLLGGKQVLAKVDDKRRDGVLVGRVYLTQQLRQPPVELTKVQGYDLVDVSDLFHWLKFGRFDVEVLKAALRK